MIQRSYNGNRGRATIMSSYNDIDIFIEDQSDGTKKLYKNMLKRALNGRYEFKDVTPLGSKENVLRSFDTDLNPKKRPRLHIVDGDIDLLSGNSRRSCPGLFVLPRYCIENFMIDEFSIVNFLDDECIEDSCDKKHLAGSPEWLQKNCKYLRCLFIEYAVAIVVGVEDKTINYSAVRLCNGNFPHFSGDMIYQRVMRIRNKTINKCGHDEYYKIKSKIDKASMFGGCFVARYVSFKEYIFPILKKYLHDLGVRFNTKSLYSRMGKTAPLCELADIPRYVWVPPTP